MPDQITAGGNGTNGQQAVSFSASNLTLGGKGRGAEKGHQGSIALNTPTASPRLC